MRALVVSLVILTVSACSLLPWSSFVPEAPIDASVDGVTDGPVEAGFDASDASDAGDAGPHNLLSDPGFEGAVVGCGAWQGFGASASISTDGHSSAKSCMVCVSGSANGALYAEIPVVGAPGDAVRWSFFVEVPDGGGAMSVPGAQIDLTLADGGVDSHFWTKQNLMADWQPYSFTVASEPVAFTKVGMNLTVHSEDGGPACLLFDDVSLLVGK